MRRSSARTPGRPPAGLTISRRVGSRCPHEGSGTTHHGRDTMRRTGWGRRPAKGGVVAVPRGWSRGITGGLAHRRPGPAVPRYGRHVGTVICLLDGDLLRGAKVADRAAGQVGSGVQGSIGRTDRIAFGDIVDRRRVRPVLTCRRDRLGRGLEPRVALPRVRRLGAGAGLPYSKQW
jgi:hypothetical protein